MAGTDVSPQLSVQQQLVLAQAVHHAGESDFAKVASLLTKHPLLNDAAGSSLASPQTCSKTYSAIRVSNPLPEPAAAKPMKSTLALSRILYSKRIQELHDTISAEEAKFRILNAEIEEIKRGDWDAKLKDPEEREKVLSSGAFEASAPAETTPAAQEEEEEASSPAAKVEAASPESRSPPSKEKRRPGRPRRSARGATVGTDEGDASANVVPDSAEPEDKDGDEDEPVAVLGKRKKSTTVEPTSPDKEDAEDAESPAPSGRRGRSARGRKPSKAPPSTRKSRSQAAEAEADEDAGDENEPEADEDAMEVDPTPEEAVNKSRGSNKRSAPSVASDDAVAVGLAGSASGSPSKRTRRISDTSASIDADAIDPVVFKRRILQILSQVVQTTSSSVFREPVREADAPDYAATILRPMDLKSIGRRIRDGKIATPNEFRRDVLLMLANAVVYNQPGSEVARNAKEVLTLCDSLVDLFVSSQYS